MPPERTLTDADLEALREFVKCNSCAFTQEEILFVRGWLETAKTAKSEVIKWLVKMVIIGAGLLCGLYVAVKLDILKMFGK